MISEEEAVALFGPHNDEDTDHVQILAKRRKQRLFLRGFASTGVVLDGLLAAGVSRDVEHYWRKNDEAYLALFRVAEAHAADIVEREAIRRAVHGYEEPVIFQGQPTIVTDEATGKEKVYTTRKYSDGLMALVLKGRRREVYGDKVEQTHDFKKGGVLVVPGQVLDADAWAKAAAEQQAQFSKPSDE